MDDIEYEMRPLWTGDGDINFFLAKDWGFIQLPMWSQIADVAIDQITMSSIYIKMRDPSNEALRSELITSLKKNMNDETVEVRD